MTEGTRKPPGSAVALAYQPDEGAPRVVAKGKGLVASEIIRKAQEAGVFVHESRELVYLLMQVDLDREIPPALYRVVAELLAWLYYVDSAQAGSALKPPAFAGLPQPDLSRDVDN